MNDRSPGWSPLVLKALVPLIIVLLCGLGIAMVLVAQEGREQARLNAIADLKTRQIVQWLRERAGDAEMVRISPSLLEEYGLWEAHDNLAAAGRMQARLAPLLAKGAFKSIDLHGPDGRLVWSTAEPLEETAPELTRALQQVRHSRRVARVGPYLHASGNGHLDFVVPLGEDAGPTPLVVLRTDIEDGLCPILSTWPSPSQSGESLLIRRDGARVLHLCPSRHRPDAAMRLSLPVVETSLLSARLLRGELAPGEAGVARDYRGVPVLGVAQPIADSDWLVVTKIDRAEIRASAMPQIALVVLTGTGALLAVIGLMATLRNRERLALATATQEAQIERLRALGLLAALADSSDDAIFAKDLDGRYTLINQSASRLFGITPDAALGHTDHELLTPELADAFIAHDRQAIANDAPIRFEEQVNPPAGRLTLLTTKGPLRDPSGRVIGVFGIARDITARKAADAARRESEGRLRIFIEHAPAALAMFDREMRYLAVSRRWLEDYGLGDRDILGESHYSVFPEISERWKAFHARGLAGEVIVADEDDFPRQDGSVQWLRWEIRPWQTSDGKVGGIVIFSEDITVRKQVELDLRESRQRFQDIATASADCIWEVDAQIRYTYVSDGVQSVLGYQPEEILGRTPFDMMPPDEAERVMALFDDFRARRIPFRDLANINRHKDGRLLHIQTSALPILGSDGQLLGYRGLDRDVTEKRLAEIALEDSRELLRALVSSIPDLVWLKDPQGAFLTCNARFESFIGAPEAGIIGKTDHDFLLPEEASACRASDLAAFSTAGSAVTEEELTFASDGHRELVQVIKTPVYDASGAQIGVLGIGRDITRIKQAEQELERHRHHLEDLVAERTKELMEARAEAERLSRAKGELLANMSHEIRTPLHAVLSLAYLLERRELSPEARDLVRKIHEAGRGLLGIINDVLDFSRLESNRIELERVPFQLEEVLGRLATIMTASTADKSIELVISPPDCIDFTLLGDPLRLGQILVNLTGNAIKFTESGVVEVRIATLKRTRSLIDLRFSVRDTGIGIDAATQARLFQPFMQGDTSTTRRFGGSGLGLAICRRLVELMGGDLRLESTPGAGSHFWFELSLEILDSGPARERSERMRVLIVDGKPVVRAGLEATVAALCWSSLQASSSRQALRRVLREESWQGPDALILLHDQMSGMSAPRTAEAIRRALPESAAPLLFLVSAYPVDASGEMPGVDAIDAVLPQPLTPSALRDAVLSERRRRLGPQSLVPLTMTTSERRLADLRLLVVDDSDINREVAQRIFAEEGAEVYLAENGRDAVEWLRAHPEAVDLVLMDVQMPIMDGRTATRMIRQTPELAELPILALTADALKDQEAAALAAGMDGFLAKPFDVPVAIALIRSLARRPAAKDAGDSISTGAADDRQQDAQAVPEAAPGSQDDRVCAISVSPPPDNGTDRQERLPGIAIDQWLGLWKDPDLYRRYLRRFARDYADSVRSIAAAEPEQAHALIHKLKGTAGTLGLIEVAARATDWEQQVAQGLTATLGPLQEALDTALASIARYAPEEPVALDAPTQSTETIPREQVAALLGAVLAACDQFDTPAAEPALDALAAVLPRAQLAPLRQAIDDFDATAAAALTRALAASLAIELED